MLLPSLLHFLLQFLNALLERLVLSTVLGCDDKVAIHDAFPVELVKGELPEQVVATLCTQKNRQIRGRRGGVLYYFLPLRLIVSRGC